MKKFILSAFFACAVCAAAVAQDYNWSKPDDIIPWYFIEVKGANNQNVPLKPDLMTKKPVNCTVEQRGNEETRAFNIHVILPKKRKKDSKEFEWVTSSFTFTNRSRYKTKISITLRLWGDRRWKDQKADLRYDLPDVGFIDLAQYTSKQIKFPSISSPNLKAWGVKEQAKDVNLRPTIETDKTLPLPNKKYMHLCNNLNYVFDAKPGQEFTVTITHRPSDMFRALH